MLGEATPEDGRPQIAELAPDVVHDHPEWLDEAKKLVELPVCRYWIFDPEDVEPHLEHYGRNKIRELKSKESGVPDLGAMGDEAIIVRRAVRELFDEKRRPRVQRRLEETAILLWLISQPDEARWAAATALSLAEGAEAEDVPFLYELVRLSLDRAMALAVQEARKDSADLEEDEDYEPSEIILPGEAFQPPPSPDREPPQTPGGIYLPR